MHKHPRHVHQAQRQDSLNRGYLRNPTPHENWLSSVVRAGFGVTGEVSEITLFDLLKNAMRQRPEYIIVGEVRGAEAYTLMQAIATGHGGLATLHADSAEAAIHRLESEPMNIPRPLIPTIDVIAVQTRV